MRRRLSGILLGIVILAADQASKYAVLHQLHMQDGHFLVLAPVLNFVLVWNHGVTFGMFNALGGFGYAILAAIALAVIIGLGIWLWNTPRLITTLAIGAIAGGATGNVLDRLHYGAVVDFIQAHIGPYSWYVFNVGDAAIVCGVIVLMAESLLARKPGER